MEFVNMKDVLLSSTAPSLLFADALPNTYPLSGEHLALTRGSSWESHRRNEITSAQTNRVKLSRRRALGPHFPNYVAHSRGCLAEAAGSPGRHHVQSRVNTPPGEESRKLY